MFDRIPVKIIFRDENIDKNTVLEKFKNETIFYPKELCNDYFSTLIETLLEEKDPLLIINNFLPDINGQMYLEIVVKSENTPTNPNCFEMVYSQDIDFQESISSLISNIRRSKYSVSNGIFNKILPLKNPSKDIADLYFIDKNYKDALTEYHGLYSQYPELSRRMCEICRMILGSKPTLDLLTIDILIFYKKYDDLFDLSKDVLIDLMIPIHLLLSKSDLSIKKRLITAYFCYKNLKKINELDKSNICLQRFESIFEECILEDTKNNLFLNEIKNIFNQ